MKYRLDRPRCEGHGFCAGMAPEVFELDENGELIARLEGEELPEHLHDAVRDAVRVCPVAALSIEGES
jgi:ferredoxin